MTGIHALAVSAAAIAVVAAAHALQPGAAGQSKDIPALNVTIESRAVQPGEVVVLTVTSKHPISDVRVHAFDRNLAGFRVDAQSWRVLVGIDLETKPQTYWAEITAVDHPPPSRAAVSLRVLPRQFRTRTLTV